MSIVGGYFCLLCLLLLTAKAFTNKLHLTKADRLLRKIHKPACAALAAFGPIHLILALPVFATRSRLVIVTGISSILLLALIIIVCHFLRTDSVKWMRWHRILTVLTLLCLAGHIAFYYTDYQNYRNKISRIQLQEIDMDVIADGKYVGEYDAGYIYAKVEATVRRGRVQHIRILQHKNERGKAAEKVLSEISDTGAFPVDAVSGATNSSMVIQKAVENALIGAGRCSPDGKNRR